MTLSVDVDEVGEGADPTGITVTGTLAGETPTAAVEVTLSVESGTGADGAAGGADFAPVEEFGLTIPVGQASATASFTLTPIEDTVDEPAETLTLSGATEASGVGIAGPVTLSLTDNDDAPLARALGRARCDRRGRRHGHGDGVDRLGLDLRGPQDRDARAHGHGHPGERLHRRFDVARAAPPGSAPRPRASRPRSGGWTTRPRIPARPWSSRARWTEQRSATRRPSRSTTTRACPG